MYLHIVVFHLRCEICRLKVGLVQERSRSILAGLMRPGGQDRLGQLVLAVVIRDDDDTVRCRDCLGC